MSDDLSAAVVALSELAGRVAFVDIANQTKSIGAYLQFSGVLGAPEVDGDRWAWVPVAYSALTNERTGFGIDGGAFESAGGLNPAPAVAASAGRCFLACVECCMAGLSLTVRCPASDLLRQEVDAIGPRVDDQLADGEGCCHDDRRGDCHDESDEKVVTLRGAVMVNVARQFTADRYRGNVQEGSPHDDPRGILEFRSCMICIEQPSAFSAKACGRAVRALVGLNKASVAIFLLLALLSSST